jgi:hypothetical protein
MSRHVGVPASRAPAALVAGTIAIVLATGLIISWPSLARDWNWDDLHLVRPYTAADLAGTLVGRWDPDGIETLGYRPGTTVFNHLRAVIFGEQFVAHRLFLLVLYASALAVVADLARRLGAGTVAVATGAFAAIVAKNSYYHYVWLADGVHVLQLLFGALALHAAHRYFISGGRRPFAAMLTAFALALVTREDSLALLPALAGIALLPALLDGTSLGGPPAARARWRRAAVAFGLLLPLWWLWRLAWVSRAPNVKLEFAAIDRFVDMLVWTASPVGGVDPLWPWFVGLAIGLAASTAWLPAPVRRRAWLWLLAAVAACVIGNVRARANLLILPATFYGFFAGEVFAGWVRRSGRAALVAAAVAVLTAAAAVRASRIEQVSLHPMSADQVFRDWQFIAGPFRAATIPGPRRARAEARLAALGLLRPDADLLAWQAELRRDGRVGPQPDGGPFLPVRPFLEWAIVAAPERD